MAKATAAKRAKKPKPITKKQLEGKPASEQKAKPEKLGIMLVMDDGPVTCLVPIPRGDLPRGCERFTLPHHWDTVTYVLDRVVDGVHHYRWEP